MLLVPERFRDEVVWLWNRLAGVSAAPQFPSEPHVLCAVLAMGLAEHRQAQVFASIAGGAWLQNIAPDDRRGQMRALARCFEGQDSEASSAPNVARLSRAAYPLALPAVCETNFRAYARDLGCSPEAALCALLSVAVASMRQALAAADPAAELSRLAA
jgi:hypothetical protein